MKNPVRGTLWLPDDVRLDEICWLPSVETTAKPPSLTVKRRQPSRWPRRTVKRRRSRKTAENGKTIWSRKITTAETITTGKR